MDDDVVFDEAPSFELQLSPDQAEAFDAILAWHRSGSAPFFTLGGYAGSGKSTLVKQIVRAVGSHVRVCAYTGKAAHVLRSKGVEGAQTIHSLIYAPETHCKLCDALLSRDEGFCARYPGCKKAGTSTTFELVPAIDAEMIIVDEASMVDGEIHRDLLAYGIPVLYVGDHGQLEPVNNENNPRIMVDPDVRLEQIHRQAENSPILRFAHHVRQHRLPETMGPEARVLYTSVAPKDAHEYDVVLVGKNETRVAMNGKIRRSLGFSGDLPQEGERIVCLRNCRDYAIFNGMLATVLKVHDHDTVEVPEIDVVDDDGKVRKGMKFAPEQFGSRKRLDHVSRKRALFDFGYALTVHKSQGSAWKRVLVLEWIHPETSAARWRYTAATRASEHLTYAMRDPRGQR
jgi:ATP-dependent exoDNAse (exonuclease V), alpha subunit - helicase superfamily I member